MTSFHNTLDLRLLGRWLRDSRAVGAAGGRESAATGPNRCVRNDQSRCATETETGETYAETWGRSTKDERRDLMRSAGVVVTLAPGSQGSKQWEPRLTFAMGAAVEYIGTDDALAGEW
jgi:hypothetical protein